MKSFQRLSIPFFIILLLGGLMFTHQTRRLGELQKRSESVAAADHIPALSQEESRLPETPTTGPAKPSPDPDLPGAFLATLKEKLVSSIKPEQLTSYLGEDGRFERIGAGADLSDEERAAVHQGLKPFDLQKARLYLDLGLTPAARARELAAVKRRKDEWLVAHLGKQLSDAFFLADQRHALASAEQQAAVAISRLSYSLDLSEDQQAELRTGLVDRVLHPEPTEEMPELGTSGMIQMEPPAPDISEEVKAVLTPEQRSNYQKQSESARKNAAQQAEIMNAITESIQPALEELLKMTP